MSVARTKERRPLPPGWRWVELKDLGNLTDGDWILSEHYAVNGVRLIQVGDVGRGHFIGKSSRFIAEETAARLDCTLLQAGDILISRMPDPLGRACIFPGLSGPAITAVDVSIFRPSPNLSDAQYLVRVLNSPMWFSQVAAAASGATRARISRRNLESLPIPLPPLLEQRRIASMLSGQMVVVDKARAAVQAQLEAAKGLPRAYSRQLFGGHEARQWPQVPLSHLIDTRRSITYGVVQTGANVPEGVPTVRGGDIKDFSIESTSLKRIDPQLSEQFSRTLLQGDEVLFAIRGSVGAVAAATSELVGCNISREVALIPVGRTVDKNYLAYALGSPSVQSKVLARVQGAAQRGINLSDVARLTVPVPSLSEQQRIVKVLDEYLQRNRRLVDNLRSSRVALEALSSSVLSTSLRGGR